jgi:sugar/nucleoside kinase (ribokinase family)
MESLEKKVLCIGLMVCDISVSPVTRDIFHLDSQKMDRVSMGAGGDALNVAVNLSKLGVSARVVGRIGTDSFGNAILEIAQEAGVDTSHVCRLQSEQTAVSIVLIEPGGERRFLYHGGGNDNFCTSDVTDVMLAQIDFLVIGSLFALPALQMEPLRALLLSARARGIITLADVSGNPGPEQASQLKEILPYLDYFLPSLGETIGLVDTLDVQKAARIFLNLGAGCVIIKCGDKGAYYASERCEGWVKSFPVQQVDSTGAGDAFVSGFVVGLTNSLSLAECVEYGCAAGALCVTGIGATSAISSKKEFLDFLSQYDSDNKLRRSMI